MALVLGLGGSVLAPDEPDAAFVASVAAALGTWSDQDQLFVVVGGGRTARRAIAMARNDSVTEERLDRIGIAATRLNAQLLLAALDAAGIPCNDDVPLTCAAAMDEVTRVVVMGGTTPGHSTDYVAAQLARAVGATRFVNATNVDAVYKTDPRIDPDAERVESCTYAELAAIVGPAEWKQAGQAGVVDPLAVALLQGSGIETCVVEGHDLDNVGRALAGEAFTGTRVADL